VTITTAIFLAVYALVNSNAAGWISVQTLAPLAGAWLLLALFIFIETRAQIPLMPLGLLRARNVAVANAVGALWSAALIGWSVNSTLYLQRILGLSTLGAGLAFLPGMLITGVISFSISPMLIKRFGSRRSLVAGLILAATGLAMLAQAPFDASVVLDVLPAMVLVGIAAGVAQNAVLLSAMGGVSSSRDYGAASGLVSVFSSIGGALGLAALAAAAASRTEDWLASGADLRPALHAGYQLAFGLSAVLAAVAAMLSALFIRERADSRSSDNGDKRRAAITMDTAPAAASAVSKATGSSMPNQ
jgi:Na+/melibiose symporter-like transporter